MAILVFIIIVIVIIILLIDYRDYKKVEPAMKEFHNELVDEGKQLRKDAEEKMKEEKCKEGGNCDFVLEKKTSKYLPGWDYEITGHYKCTKCGNTRDEIIQYPS